MSEDYLESRRQQFETDGFQCYDHVDFGERRFALVAVKRRASGGLLNREIEEAFILAKFGDLDLARLLQFVADGRAWARLRDSKKKQSHAVRLPFGGVGRYVYCVALVPEPNDLLLAQLDQLPRLVEGGVGYFIPVVFDVQGERVHQSKSAPVLGGSGLAAIKKTSSEPVSLPVALSADAIVASDIEPDVPVLEAVSDADESPGRKSKKKRRRESRPVSGLSGFRTLPLPLEVEELHPFMEKLYRGEHFWTAIVVGMFVAVFVGGVWGTIDGMTSLALEWAPLLGIGCLVGNMVRVVGKGMHRRFGVAAAVLTVLSWVVCHAVSTSILVVNQTPGVDRSVLLALPSSSFWWWAGLDLLHWTSLVAVALSLPQAYYYAFRRFSVKEIAYFAERGDL